MTTDDARTHAVLLAIEAEPLAVEARTLLARAVATGSGDSRQMAALTHEAVTLILARRPELSMIVGADELAVLIAAQSVSLGAEAVGDARQ